MLIDYRTPTVDSFEATEAIRTPAMESTKTRLPKVSVTAHTMVGYGRLCSKAGTEDYKSKPVYVPTLLHSIPRVINRDEEQTADSPPSPTGGR